MGACFVCCSDENSARVDTPQARRKLLTAKVECPPGVKVDEEYVVMPDGNVLFSRCYIPNIDNNSNDNNDSNNSVNGMICYNHGYGDHINCLVHDIAIEWIKRGYIFFTHEHFGHGRSDGLYIYCPDFNQYVKHSSYIHKYAKLKYSKLYNIPNNGYFFGGESLGGAISIHQSIYESQLKQNKSSSNNNINQNNENSQEESDLKVADIETVKLNPNDNRQENSLNIVSATSAIDDNVDVPEWNGMFLAAPMCMVDKEIRPPEWVETIFRYCIVPLVPKLRQAPAEDLDPWLLSPDAPEIARVKFFERNELRLEGKMRMITANSYLDATDFIEKNGDKLTIPVILVHSKGDKVTNPVASQKFVEMSASTDKEIKIYDKGYHCIWHDCVKEQVYQDVENWINRRMNV